VAVDVEEILRRRAALADQTAVQRSTWEEQATYIHPRRLGIITKRTPGAKRTDKLFDSTAPRANELLAASMQGTLTSNAVKWFRLTLRDKSRLKDAGVAEWLDVCAERIYTGFQQSNFGSEVQEVYLELGPFGTGAYYLDEREGDRSTFNGFRFQALPIGSYDIGENAEGRVDTIFQTLTMSLRAAHGRWGNKVGDNILRKMEKSPDAMTDVVHGCYRRKGGKYGERSGRKPFASCWIALDGKTLLEEGGFDTFPYMVPRWAKAAGEVWGFGPGSTALADIKTLNHAKMLNLRAWAKAIDPPLKQLHDGVLGTVKLQPSSLTTVYQMDAVMPFEFKSRFDVTTIEVADLRESIRNCFYWDQLQLPAGHQMVTATEVERRLELMQRILGPTLGRLETELLQPTIERAFGLLLNASIRSKWQDTAGFPEPPETILEMMAGGGDIDIEFLGPLSRVQRASDVSAVERTLAVAAPILQIDEDAGDVIRWDKTVRLIAERSGVPSELLADEDEVKKKRAAKTQAREEAARIEQMKTMSESARNAAPLLEQLGGVPGAGAQETA
jgi:hypothetical protein